MLAATEEVSAQAFQTGEIPFGQELPPVRADQNPRRSGGGERPEMARDQVESVEASEVFPVTVVRTARNIHAMMQVWLVALSSAQK